jgi:hypothetical protein
MFDFMFRPEGGQGLWERIAGMFGGGGNDRPPTPAQAGPQAAGASAQDAAPVFSHFAEPNVAPEPERGGKNGEESVVYLGLNAASREAESKVFKGMDNATVINGSGKDDSMDGKVMSSDGKTVLDLSNEAHLQKYLSEVGVGNVRTDEQGHATESKEDAAQRMQTMQNLFLGTPDEKGARQGGLPEGIRDEMAGFVKVLQGVETGERTMDRLVMSGHSTGEWVYGEQEGNPGVTFAQMAQLMGQFPKAQGGVEDLMLSACHTLEKQPDRDTRGGEQYQEMLPNVESVWGYNGFSPSWKQGSVQHVKNWLKASQTDDLDLLKKNAKQTGQNATVKTY